MKKYPSHVVFGIRTLTCLGRTIWSVTSRVLNKKIPQGLVTVFMDIYSQGKKTSCLFNLADISVFDRHSVTTVYLSAKIQHGTETNPNPHDLKQAWFISSCHYIVFLCMSSLCICYFPGFAVGERLIGKAVFTQGSENDQPRAYSDLE